MKNSQLVIDRFHNVIINAHGKAHNTGYVLGKVGLKTGGVGNAIFSGYGYSDGGVFRTHHNSPLPVLVFHGDKPDIEYFLNKTGWHPLQA